DPRDARGRDGRWHGDQDTGSIGASGSRMAGGSERRGQTLPRASPVMGGLSARMRVVGIIHARMGSTRLPGDMLAGLAGRPLLWHIITRMRMAVSLDDLALATTSESGDDILAMFAKGLGLAVIRGPEENVLQRFVMAAEARRADVVVRINGDAPL